MTGIWEESIRSPCAACCHSMHTCMQAPHACEGVLHSTSTTACLIKPSRVADSHISLPFEVCCRLTLLSPASWGQLPQEQEWGSARLTPAKHGAQILATPTACLVPLGWETLWPWLPRFCKLGHWLTDQTAYSHTAQLSMHCDVSAGGPCKIIVSCSATHVPTHIGLSAV